MKYPIIGIIAGVIIGFACPFTFPAWASPYVAVAILACADTVVGGIVAILERKFNRKIFISGFFVNAFLAVGIVWLGEQLNIELVIAAIVVFGSRLFQNFAYIRRFLLNKNEKEDNI